MRVCAISGGVGSARFCAGLGRILDPSELTIVVNTGDDETIRGLKICPDIDTVLYHLAGATDWDRGWGLASESFVSNERYGALAARADVPDVDLQDWFALGDRDLATHLLRARLLDAGLSLTAATAALGRALGAGATVLPASNEEVRTVLRTSAGEHLDFQEYFVHRRQAEEITSVEYRGAEAAHPAPGVVEAIEACDVVVIPPSNPILSIFPVLAVAGVRDAVASHKLRIAVSPIVGGRALKGPADRILAALGHEVSPVGVARLYEDLVDVFVLDAVDAELAGRASALGVRAEVCDTIMSGPEEAARLAKDVLDRAVGS